MTDREDDMLDWMFADARANPPALPETAIEVLQAQALAVQPRPARWRRATALVGGLPGVGGLVASVVLGLWVGVAPPEGIAAQVDALLGIDQNVPQMIGFGWDVEEG